MSNPFHERIKKLAREVLEEESSIVLDKRVDERIEKHLEETVPAIIAAELHRLLEGGDSTKPTPPQRPAASAGMLKPRLPKTKPPAKRKLKPKCDECGKALKSDGTHWGGGKCKKK